MGKTVIESNLQLDWKSLTNLMSGTTIYHADEDTFLLRQKKPQPATSFDWDGELWIRCNPQTGEIVGIEIENFEQIFERFKDSIIVISYGHPGTPPISRIESLLRCFKSEVTVLKKEYTYKLNRRNGEGLYEVLIIGK